MHPPRSFQMHERLCCFLLVLCFRLSTAALIDASTVHISTWEYDYVVVGCGVAGLAVAGRLSEDDLTTVLCLEAGVLDKNEDVIRYPHYIGLQPPCFYEWCIDSVPQPQLDNETRRMPMGKAVGGGSLTNGMLWNRGAQVDYENWASLGNPAWNWSDILPYFKKSENFKAQWYADETANLSAPMDSFNTNMHGYHGPTNVSYPQYLWPQSAYWFEALEELGIPKAIDPNDGSTAGGYFIPLNIEPVLQTRVDARTAYYNPACERTNFDLAINAQVTRINFEGNRGPAEAMQYPFLNISAPVKHKGRRHHKHSRQEQVPLRATAVEFACSPQAPRQTIFARREVIIAAGAIHTPQLLELSGLGSSDVLTALNITVRQHLPGVGNNLQDHAMIHLNYHYENYTLPSPDTLLTNASYNSAAEQQYLSSRTGPWTAKPSTAVAFPSLSQITSTNYTDQLVALASLDNFTAYLPPSTLASPELLAGYAQQIKLILTALLSPDTPTHEILNDNAGALDIALMRPLSRGTTHVTSSNPFNNPAINPNYLAHPLDRAIMSAAVHFNQRLLTTPALAQMLPSFNHVPFDPTDTQIADLLNAGIGTEYHASGTCAMMPREMGGVVDSHLTVYGTQNLRVVDASVFPVIPGAHLQAVVVAVAERAADIIRNGVNLPV